MPTSIAHIAALTDARAGRAFARLANALAIPLSAAAAFAGRDKTESFRTRARVSGNFPVSRFPLLLRSFSFDQTFNLCCCAEAGRGFQLPPRSAQLRARAEVRGHSHCCPCSL